MRKIVVFALVMVLALSLFATGCVQKSEMDKAVADLNAKVKAAQDQAAATKKDLDAANAKLKTLEPFQVIADKFSKEVNVWGVTAGKLVSAKARVAIAAKPEDLVANAITEALKNTAMPAKTTLVKFAVKADTATVTLSKEFKAGWSKDVPTQKMVFGAIVNTALDNGLTAVKKVIVTTAAGSVVIDKTTMNKAVTLNDAAFTK